ncbi:MAG: thermonuclease family protein [Verrucomicrobiales bacterium]
MRNRNQILATVAGAVALAAILGGAWYYKQIQLESLKDQRAGGPAAKPRILSEFEPVRDNVAVAVPETALGHRVSLRDEKKEASYLVSQYFVECPPLTADEADKAALARIARYFGDVPLEKLLEMGQAAKDFTLRQLSTRPFKLATLFRQTPDRQGIYGFIILRAEDGTEEHLSELLVAEGLGSITVQGNYLPYGERAEDFRKHLVNLEKKAKEEKRGIWAFSRKPDEAGASGATTQP